MLIVTVDVVASGASQYDQWTLDSDWDVKGVARELLRELALAGLILRPTPSKGEYEHVAATV